MAKQTINIGSAANDGTGDPLRTAFSKANDNFGELYAVTGAGSGQNIAISGQKIISENVNGNIELDPNGTGKVVIATAAELRFTDHVDNAVAFVDADGDIKFDSKLTYNPTTNIAVIEDINIKAATISTANSNQDITISPSGTGVLNLATATQATVGSAGSATALPAQPTGYIKLKISGTLYIIPFYAAS